MRTHHLGNPNTAALTTRGKARRTLAANAHNADDLKHLLDVLGLWPHQDHTQPRTGPFHFDPHQQVDPVRTRRPKHRKV